MFGIAEIKRLPCPTGPTKGHAAVSVGLKGMTRQHCKVESKLGHLGEYAPQAMLYPCIHMIENWHLLLGSLYQSTAVDLW